MAKLAIKKSTLKILSLVLPLLVITAALAVTTYTYAWFSTDIDPTIDSLNLSTVDAFALTFTSSSIADDGTKYSGQTAFDTDGHIITSTWAKDNTNGGRGLTDGSAQYNSYMLDAPFAKSYNFSIDTEGKSIDLSFNFGDVQLWDRYYETDLEGNIILGSNGFPVITSQELIYSMPFSGDVPTSVEGATTEHIERTSSDIPYSFTWYLKKVGDENNLYTPYGTLDMNKDYPLSNTAFDNPPTGIEKFTASDETYQLFIVFCPEKMYWAQYNQRDWTKTVTQLYSVDEIAKIMDDSTNKNANINTSTDKPYYSTGIYIGVDFEYVIIANVTHVY